MRRIILQIEFAVLSLLLAGSRLSTVVSVARGVLR